MRRTLQPLVLATLVVLSASCSGAPGSNGPGGTGSSGDNTNVTATTTREQAVKFAECMRKNGVSDFPDPNASGDFVYGIAGGSSLDPRSPAFTRAISACKDLEPPGALGEGKRSPKEMEAALKFAQCMRDNGVKDFPDPSDTGPLIDTSKMGPNGMAAHSIPGFQAAAQKCLAIYSGAVGGQ